MVRDLNGESTSEELVECLDVFINVRREFHSLDYVRSMTLSSGWRICWKEARLEAEQKILNKKKSYYSYLLCDGYCPLLLICILSLCHHSNPKLRFSKIRELLK